MLIRDLDVLKVAIHRFYFLLVNIMDIMRSNGIKRKRLANHVLLQSMQTVTNLRWKPIIVIQFTFWLLRHVLPFQTSSPNPP